MGESITTRNKARFNAKETSQFTFNKKFKVTSMPSAGKIMLAVFWASQEVLLANFQKRGEIVNSASYCEDLLELRDAFAANVQTNWQALLHHSNARPHTAPAIQELEHPSYSPDFAPSDFHVFGPLKITLIANVPLMMKRLK
jgi:hypothetical protein